MGFEVVSPVNWDPCDNGSLHEFVEFRKLEQLWQRRWLIFDHDLNFVSHALLPYPQKVIALKWNLNENRKTDARRVERKASMNE